ncbi:hypothetical protein LGQ10_06875 [Pseudomonas sp. L5B5]|uniref:hypothetical protein n=1 Tax=Pseudomonas sp. L5B5 TaxID=2883205 RepID=UPI001CFAEBD8|nr:hypothetical protein [Pseudomonas sp. L5B5]UCZ86020.1 hypothetical protein LGQ10_06875 [Pseudomonas sp. L5B5]
MKIKIKIQIKSKSKSQARLRALRRSRLAGEEAVKSCIAWADAFAGKPAPTWRYTRPHLQAGRRPPSDFDLDLPAPLDTMAERRH